MSDMIDRQAAIEAVETKIKKWNAVDGEGYYVGLGLRYTDVIDTLTELPSAEPEIIRCKDCKYWISDGCKEVGCLEDDFCSYAERRGEQE